MAEARDGASGRPAERAHAESGDQRLLCIGACHQRRQETGDGAVTGAGGASRGDPETGREQLAPTPCSRIAQQSSQCVQTTGIVSGAQVKPLILSLIHI